jgi:hypothetical protein
MTSSLIIPKKEYPKLQGEFEHHYNHKWFSEGYKNWLIKVGTVKFPRPKTTVQKAISNEIKYGSEPRFYSISVA